MPFIYFIVSFGATLIGAISGIGGGVIIKPVMDVICPFSVSTISFLSGTTVLSMSIVTLWRSRQSPVRMKKRIGTLIALGGIIGGVLGKVLFDLIRNGFANDRVIGATQSLVLTLITGGIFLYSIFKNRIKSHHFKGSLFCVAAGLFLGTMASFLGIGGGPINLAVLTYFFGMDTKTAALSSIFIIFFSQLTNLIFTLGSGNLPPFDPAVLILMITGGITGGLLGSQLSHKMSHKEVDILFTGVMAVIICICLYNFIGFIK